MASPILPALGLGSGLNTTAIVEALVSAEKTPKQNQIDRQTKANTASISAIGNLKSAFATYKAALEKLGSTTTPQFVGYAATTSDEKSVKATATDTAVGGTYSVKVNELATASKVASQRFGSSSDAIGEGTLEISQNGTVHKVEVGAGATLQSVRDSINSLLNSKGITANIINDGQGSRLVLTSTTTGLGSDISVGGDIPEMVINGKAAMTGAGGGFISAVARDAEFVVDGMTLTNKSNKVENAISGLTLDLVAKGSTETTITVATNTDGLKKSVQTFVDAYNALVSTINSATQTPKNADGSFGTPPALAGDSLARGMLTALRNELVAPSSGGNGQLQVLSQLGINTVQGTGLLEIDSAKFTAALETQKLGGQIGSLFTGEGGLASRMTAALEPFTKADGLLADRSKVLEVTKKNLTTQQSNLDSRITLLTASLTKKYNTMDTLVGQLNAQRDNITSIFDAMAAQAKNS